jgi:hypothetical protein
MKAISKHKDDNLTRIAEYAGAIRAVGLKNLMNYLIEAGVLPLGYSYDTFKTNYRRLKANQKGLFFSSGILMSIWPFLDGFTYQDLFGKAELSETNTDEKLLPHIEALIDKKLPAFVQAIRQEEKSLQNSKKREYTHGKALIESSKAITEKIQNGLNGQRLAQYAMEDLFINYTYKDKKNWRHGKSDRLSRIDKIFNHMTGSGYNNQYYCEVIETGQGRDKSNENGIYELDVLGNYYITIAYQIYLIEILYELYSRKDIKFVSEEKFEQSGITNITITRIRIKKEYDEKKHRDAFRDCIKKFYVIFDARLSGYLDQNFTIFPLSSLVPSYEYLNGLFEIIKFLQQILENFSNPPMETTLPFGGWNPQTTLEMYDKKQKREENNIVQITNDILLKFSECYSYFDNLPYNEKIKGPVENVTHSTRSNQPIDTSTDAEKKSMDEVKEAIGKMQNLQNN